MPKAARYKLTWAAERERYELNDEGGAARPAPQDQEGWATWLAAHAAFAFHGRGGALNLLKEQRARGAGYWYAYRRHGARMAKKYAGRSSDLTIERLEELAGGFAGHDAAPQPTAVPGASRRNTVAVELTDPDGSSDESPTRPLAAPLLESKLKMPRLRGGLVVRQRLLTRLDDVLERRLLLVSAPAGYGKTTLVGQWIAARSAGCEAPGGRAAFPATAWLTLDPGDNDPTRFWRYVIAAYRSLQPGLGEAALHLLAEAQQPRFEALPLEAVLTALLNDLAQLPGESILVLEEYHTIREPQIHTTLAFWLDHLPNGAHVALVTRDDPPLPLARLRGHGDLTELRAADLRFSEHESRAFLDRIAPGMLAPKALAELTERLDGWAAGLHLLELRLAATFNGADAPGQGIEGLLASFSGSQHMLQEYFVGEVLELQPEELQRFLLQTSGLGRLCASLCDAVTGRTDSAALLDRLERSGLFLEALDTNGGWYRYHTLFAEAMQAEANSRLAPADVEELRRRASVWYEQRDLPAEAIEAALQAGDRDRAARLIARTIAAQRLNGLNEYHTVCRWLGEFPESELAWRPGLCFAYATALLALAMATGGSDARSRAQSERLLQMAEQGYRDQGDRAGLGQVFAYRALLAWQERRRVAAMSQAQLAVAHLPETERQWRSVALGLLGATEMRDGQLALAHRTLQQAQALVDESNNRYMVRANTARLGGLCVERGELRRAAEYFRQVLAEARSVGDPDDIAHTQAGLAALYYEWNNLPEARRAAEETLSLTEKVADQDVYVQAVLVLAHVEQAQGDGSAALQRLEASLARVQPEGAPARRREIVAGRAQLQMMLGTPQALDQWQAAVHGDDAEDLPLLQVEEEELIWARGLIARGDAEGALARITPLLASAEAAGRLRHAVQMRVLSALAQAAARRTAEARQTLQIALASGRGQGYCRTYLDHGEPMAALLRATLPSLRDRGLAEYVRGLLGAFDGLSAGGLSGAPRREGVLIEPLTPQERRVMRYLAAGLSNPEIARELVVSVNTVRTQVQSIYRKLAVNNRVAASQAARDLGLV